MAPHARGKRGRQPATQGVGACGDLLWALRGWRGEVHPRHAGGRDEARMVRGDAEWSLRHGTDRFDANQGTSGTAVALHGDPNRLAMMGRWPSVIATNPGGPEARAHARLSAGHIRVAERAFRLSRMICARRRPNPTTALRTKSPGAWHSMRTRCLTG